MLSSTDVNEPLSVFEFNLKTEQQRTREKETAEAVSILNDILDDLASALSKNDESSMSMSAFLLSLDSHTWM